MSPKLIAALAVVTLIATAAAVVAAIREPEATALRTVDEPAFPALREQPDAVAKAVVKTADGQITLVREAPGRWVTPDRYGYPVATDTVRRLIVELADMRLVETKTSRPERYDRLDDEAHDRAATCQGAPGDHPPLRPLPAPQPYPQP